MSTDINYPERIQRQTIRLTTVDYSVVCHYCDIKVFILSKH
jgi:hypothetical protein